jgi:hypothetical protein
MLSTPPVAADTSVTLYVRTAEGCSVTAPNAATVTVNPLPAAVVSPASVCLGHAATLTATATVGATTAMTYTWNAGGSASTSSTNIATSQITSVPATATMTTYTVRITNANGCTGALSAPATITIKGNSAGKISTQSTTVAANQSYIITNATAASDFFTGNYRWLENSALIGATGDSYTNASGKPQGGVFVYVRQAEIEGCGWHNSNAVIVTVTGSESGVTLPPNSGVKTWLVAGPAGTQTWSGYIDKCPVDNSFLTNSPDVETCRRNFTGNSLYNGRYLLNNKASLCPLPWAVPTLADLNVLMTNLAILVPLEGRSIESWTNDSYIDLWGGTYYGSVHTSGWCCGDGNPKANPGGGFTMSMWTQTPRAGNDYSALASLWLNNTTMPQVTAWGIVMGLSIRCVINN